MPGVINNVKTKMSSAINSLKSMGKNIDPTKPLEVQSNVTLKEYGALAITKVGTQMLSSTAGAYGSIFLYECFYGSQGISSGEVATIAAILTTITTVLGYLMGVVTATAAYKWRSRWGRYRQWYLIGLVPYVMLNILNFVVPDIGRNGLIAYKFTLGILSTLLSGFYGISGNIVQVISPNVTEKKSVITMQQIAYYLGYGGVYLIAFVLGRISTNKRIMYLTMILIASSITIIGSVLCFLWCKERIELPKKEKVKITGATIGLFKYKNYVTYHLITFLGIFSLAGEMITYLAAIVVGSNNAVLFALPSAVGTGVGVALCTFLSRKISPVKILKFLGIYTPVMALGTFFSVYLTHSYGILFYIFYFFFGVTFGLADLSRSHLDAEINDFLEWKVGERLEAVQGIIPGWVNSALSYGRGLLIPFVLVWIGYETNTDNSSGLMEYMKALPTYDKTCTWLLAIALFGVSIQSIIRMLLLIFGYDIEGEKKKKMYAELSVIRENRHKENLLIEQGKVGATDIGELKLAEVDEIKADEVDEKATEIAADEDDI